VGIPASVIPISRRLRPNKALQLTGPRQAVIDPWYRLASQLGRFGRGRSAGPAAERLVR
jgi:hypothetical protein